jgi:iron complex transport system substrate-binding protein
MLTLRVNDVVSRVVLTLGALLVVVSSSVHAALTDTASTSGNSVLPPRVIALAPHLAQLAESAGVGKYLVAVSEYTPKAYAKQLPLVGNAFAVNWALLAQLKPTLVLVWGSGTSVAVKARLKVLGIATFESEPATLQDVVHEAHALANRLGQAQDNPDLMALHQRFQALQDYRTAHHRAQSASIAVFHPIWPKPLMTINGRHVITDALSYCGARNIFAKAKGLTPTVSMAQVLREQPSVIVLAASSAEGAVDVNKVYDKSSHWYALLNIFPKQASLQPRVISVNGDRFHQPGPSLIDETLLLCKALAASDPTLH